MDVQFKCLSELQLEIETRQKPVPVANLTSTENRGRYGRPEQDASVLDGHYYVAQPGNSCSVVIMPPACCRQFEEELETDSLGGVMPALHVTDKDISPLDLGQHKVVVVSHNYVLSEYRRLAKFKREKAKYEQEDGGHVTPP